jgi:hypothetical protein
VGERLRLFNAISGEEQAELVQTHISRWLESHRQDLTAEQVNIVEENISFVSPELYLRPRNLELFSRFKDLENRTAALLSREQMRDALTMHWDQSCQIQPR